MRNVKIIFRLIAAIFVLAWVAFIIAGRNETAMTMLLLAITSILVIICLQVSNFYHGHFVRRRREILDNEVVE